MKKMNKKQNEYITYQKTMVNDNDIKQLINDSINILPDIIKDNIKVNLYYRYQPIYQDI